MASKLAILGGAALALLLVSGFPLSADARGGGHGGGGGGHMGGMGGGHMGGMGGGHMGGGPRMFGPGMGRAHAFAFAPRRAHFANRPVFHDRRFFFHDRRFRHRRAFFVVAPSFGFADYGYGYDCFWLRRNALATGSSYWWSRYNACLYGY